MLFREITILELFYKSLFKKFKFLAKFQSAKNYNTFQSFSDYNAIN